MKRGHTLGSVDQWGLVILKVELVTITVIAKSITLKSIYLILVGNSQFVSMFAFECIVILSMLIETPSNHTLGKIKFIQLKSGCTFQLGEICLAGVSINRSCTAKKVLKCL